MLGIASGALSHRTYLLENIFRFIFLGGALLGLIPLFLSAVALLLFLTVGAFFACAKYSENALFVE
jgi:hypothetical protein